MDSLRCVSQRLPRGPSERPRALSPRCSGRCLRNLATPTIHRQQPLWLANAASGVEPMASVTPAAMATQSIAPPTTQQTASGGASAVATTLSPPPAVAFEPQLPDTGILAAQGVVLAITLAAAGYWWLVVVPSERAALGRSKRMGQLDGYLRDLERPEAARERRLERWFYSEWLRKRWERREQRHQQQRAAASGGAATDSTTAHVDDAYDSTQPGDPNLLRPSAPTPAPRFLSLDNPIVATGALLLLAAAAASLQQH